MAKRGRTKIDKQDIVGQYLGKYQVISYSGMYYDNTNGGPRLRHLYNCIHNDGTNHYVQRGQLLRSKGDVINGN